MNVLTLNGTTAVSLNRSPFSPTGNRNVAIANLSGASIQPQTSVDGTTWVNLGAAIGGGTIVERTLPGGAVSIRLAAAGSGFVLASV